MKQLCLLAKPPAAFGGDLLIDPKRSIRPLSTKNPTHLVLKSKPTFQLFKKKSVIEQIIRKQAKRFGIKIYEISIQKDHIHLNILIFSREMYKRFIRSITGLIARKLGKGIWKLRPFTRVTHWGKAYKTLKNYVLQNELEIQGVIPYQKRRHKYKARVPQKVPSDNLRLFQ